MRAVSLFFGIGGKIP